MAEAGEPAGGEPVAEAQAAADGAAVGLALARSRSGGRKGAGDPAADRFLEDQHRLALKQLDHFDEQVKRLRLQTVSERLRLALQSLTVLAGVAVLGMVGWMAWSAHEADGIVIKPFSMPPALTARGVTGEAVASKIMDRLSQMAAESNSSEQQKSIAADWGEHISIAIPETGVSISQVDQWLREKLGHQQRLTGEIGQNADGSLELDARIGSQALPVQTGADGDLNKMVTNVAEAIYGREQPTSYYLYLSHQQRWQEAFELGRQRVASPDSGERSSGYIDMGEATAALHGALAAKPFLEQARTTKPLVNPAASGNLGQVEAGLGHEERAYQLFRENQRRLPLWPRYSPEARQLQVLTAKANIVWVLGDFAASYADDIAFSETNGEGFEGRVAANDLNLATDLAAQHDPQGAAHYLADFSPENTSELIAKLFNAAGVSAFGEDWVGVINQVEAVRRLAPTRGATGAYTTLLIADTQEARAFAHLGRFAEAHALVDATPLDCVACLVARATLAGAQGQQAEADRWFAQAVRLTPSLPQHRYDWGKARLARGDARGALALFDEAHKLSDRYPDAIEGRGEALLALGDAKAADAAFAQAAKLAPRWGRLHLKWGEALAKLGKADEARAQFKAAAGLDLTADERTELAGKKL